LDTLLKQVTNPKQVVLLQHAYEISPLSIPTYAFSWQMGVTEPEEVPVSNLSCCVKVFQYDSCDLQDRDECTESPSICGERIKCLNTPGKLYSLITKE